MLANRPLFVLAAVLQVAAAYHAPVAARSRPAVAAARAPLRAVAAAATAATAAADIAPPKTNAVSRLFVGTAFSISTLASVTAVYPLLIVMTLYGMAFDNERRRFNDWIVQIWARASLSLIGSRVVVEGAENLPPPGEAVLYAPNHCSFLDIFALSGFLPRRFKYISKIEILRIPLIGWAMLFAKHIAIRRTDRASQMATFKEAIASLKAGNSLVTFPEGTRSKDGRVMDFKKGPFTMAARAGVRVVPISIIGTHLFQPPGSIVPRAVPRGVRIVVHPPLPPPAEKKEAETLAAAKAAVLSALPPSMQPVPVDDYPRA